MNFRSNRLFLRFVGYLILAISLHGCQSSSIPKTASVVAEDNNVTIFLNREDCNEIPQVSLWIHYKETNEEKRILVTHPNARGDWQQFTESVRVPVDSIPSIGCVTILSSWKNEPIALLVEGCPDHRNIYSFIVKDNGEEAIGLPTSSGLVGVAREEGLLVMESYGYYMGGGRYSIIEAFDFEGSKIDSMAPMLNPQYDVPVYSKDELDSLDH